MSHKKKQEEQKNQEEHKNQDVVLALDYLQMQAKFVDIVRVQSHPEIVTLSFISKIDYATGDNPNATIISNIAMTWPHLKRLADVINKQLANSSKNVIEVYTQALGSEQPDAVE